MAQILSPIPQPGQAGGVAAAESQVSAVLDEVKNLLNGGVAADNLTLALRSAVSPPVVTAFPSSPADGACVLYATGEARIPCRFETATNRWYPQSGQAAARSIKPADQAVATGTFATGTVSDVAVTAPATGVYVVSCGIVAWRAGNGGGTYVFNWDNPPGSFVPIGSVAATAAASDYRTLAPSFVVPLNQGANAFYTVNCDGNSNPQLWAMKGSFLELRPLWFSA